MPTRSISALSRIACLCAAACAAAPAWSQDTLDSFSQITTPKKSGKLTSFNPLVTGEVEPKNLRDILCEALLTKDGKPMQHGLSWRVFSPIPDADGKLPLLASSEGGSAAFRGRQKRQLAVGVGDG